MFDSTRGIDPNNINVNASIKVRMKKGIMHGTVTMRRVMVDGRVFLYVTPERVYHDGQIKTPESFFETGKKPLCIPATNELILKVLR